MEQKSNIVQENLEDKSNSNQSSSKNISNAKVKTCLEKCTFIIICIIGFTFILFFFFEREIQITNDLNYLNHYSIKNIELPDFYTVIQLLILDHHSKFLKNEINPSPTNVELEKLIAEFTVLDDNTLEIKILELNKSRWEVPYKFDNKMFLKDEEKANFYKRKILNQTNLHISNVSERFNFALKDDFNTDVLSFNKTYFRYLDKYIVWEVELPSQILLGLNSNTSVFLNEGSYTLYLTDEINQYLIYPFILYKINESNQWSGIFMKNSMSLSVNISFTDHKTSLVKFILIGGIIDFFIFYSGESEFILQKYHSFIGRPPLFPFWSLGYHQGIYSNQFQDIVNIVENFLQNNMPLDAVWTGLEIYNNGENLALDLYKYGGLLPYIKNFLHSNNISFIPLLEPGIKKIEGYRFYNELIKSKLYITSNQTKNPLIGLTKVGYVIYPDFINPDICGFWDLSLSCLYEELEYDGLFFSKNEYANECIGECDKSIKGSNEFDNLPFLPGSIQLNKTTLSSDAIHYNLSYEFFIHPFSSVLMAYNTIKSIPFSRYSNKLLISGCGYFGLQKYAGFSNKYSNPSWESLKNSIINLLLSNLHGFSMSGSNICENDMTSDIDLCFRWIQLGSMYTLSRNYREDSNQFFESFDFSDHLKAIFKSALLQKYSIIRFYYTKIYEASMFGNNVINSLYLDFFNDYLSMKYSSNEFLVGHSLLIIPVLEPNISILSAYLPNSDWYELRTGRQISKYNKFSINGKFFDFEASYEYVNILVKGGSIIPYQDVYRYYPRNVKDLYNIPSYLIVALDSDQKARGTLISDDENNPKNVSSERYRHFSFTFSNKILKFNILRGFKWNGSSMYDSFTIIKIFGASNYSDTTFCCILTRNLQLKKMNFYYDIKYNVLTIEYKSRRKISFQDIESVIFGSNNDYNLCSSNYYAKKLKLTDNFRRLTGIIESAPEYSPLKFSLNAILLNNNILRLTIAPINYSYFEPPYILEPDFINTSTSDIGFSDYMFAVSSYPNLFYFQISDPCNPEDPMISSELQDFILSPRLILLKTIVKAKEFYGIGERISNFKLNSGTYTIKSMDQGNNFDDGNLPGNNLYGSHPFYMIRLEKDSYGGLFLFSSNIMDISITQFDESTFLISHAISGGSLDLFYIMKGSPKFVISQYMLIIGKPVLMPFWSFGHHQSREGYNSQQELEEVINNYIKNNIPIDSIWLDRDYMKNGTSFSLDTVRYYNMQNFSEMLSKYKIKFVCNIDANIKISNNSAYQKGNQGQIFILNYKQTNHTIGISWPGYSTFVDFLNPNSFSYWSDLLDQLHIDLEFDGLCLNMNEATSFCSGECGRKKQIIDHIYENWEFDNLPYIPGHRMLNSKSIDMTSIHYGNPSISIEYNMHNTYGLYQSKTTYDYLIISRKRNRPFILSRSTFAGSGKYSAHWLGDNESCEKDLKLSISGIFNFHLFGIPMTGANVCGFYGNTTIELCKRWYQLAAFYPFCRNHNSKNSISQEPYINSDLLLSARSSILIRYSLLRYIYTCHAIFSIYGIPYFTPVFFNFYDDPNSYYLYEKSFMLGDSLIISPIIGENDLNTTTYYPGGIWYDIFGNIFYNGTGTNLTNFYKDIMPNFYIKGGSILPWQNAYEKNVMTSDDLLSINTSLIIAPDNAQNASGFLYYDNNDNPGAIEGFEYHFFQISFFSSVIVINQLGNSKYTHFQFYDENIGEIIIFGMNREWIYGKVCAYNNGIFFDVLNAYFTENTWHLWFDNSNTRYSDITEIIINDDTC